MSVYDCFPFFNELDILDIRLAELSPHVDYFVLAEATYTHTGIPKPLHFAENVERYARYRDKIIHVVVDDLPIEAGAWASDHFQRNALRRGLKDAKPTDIVMLSDADEIPDPDIVAGFRDGIDGEIHFIEHDYYCFRLDLKVLDKWIGGCATRAIEFRYLPKNLQSFRWLRARHSRRLSPNLNSLATMVRNKHRFGRFLRHKVHEHAGWHFTFVNDAARIQDKLKAFAHQEFNTPEMNSPAGIEGMIAGRKSICGRALKQVPITSLPRTVQKHRSRYAHLLSDVGVSHSRIEPLPLFSEWRQKEPMIRRNIRPVAAYLTRTSAGPTFLSGEG